ncbi:MAG TPA: molybdenum cofactor guanylyltransferase [Capillimicrobium sp.]|jgi:molybdopterin-guanine dinucleotide biosynthesis protein A
MSVAGIVLAGGGSTRMGRDKAALPWGGATLLEHVCGVLAEAVDGPVVVVRAPGQALSAVPFEVVEDPVAGRGPLQGIAAGLAAVAGRAGRAFVAAVDLPALDAPTVRAVLAALDDGSDVALPVADGHRQPLAAAYRTALAPLAAELVADGPQGTRALMERCRVRELPAAALPGGDAGLRDVDTPGDLRAAYDRLTMRSARP